MKIKRITIDFSVYMIEITYENNKRCSYSIPFQPVYDKIVSLLQTVGIKEDL